MKLLDLWAKIQMDDALYLLSGMFCANKYYQKRQVSKDNKAIKKIREYGINVIKN